MSTRAIRKVIEAYNRGAALELGVASEALAELDAIKKAAKDAMYLDADEVVGCGWWDVQDHAKWESVTDALKSIASEVAQ